MVVGLRILTCAHTISDVYNVGQHHKLTLREVNDIFMFNVYCVHQEVNVRIMVSDKIISKRTRVPIEKQVVALDTEPDLIVLEFNTRYLCENEVEGVRTWC
jgi:hypothetical protein